MRAITLAVLSWVMLTLAGPVGHSAAARRVVPADPVSWSVGERPFSLAFHDGPRALTDQRPNTAYVLTNGTTHTLTNLISTRRTARGARYTVATDEPGRRAIVAVERRDTGTVRVTTTLTPATGVEAIRPALGASLADHFLGSGERERYVDLRRHLVPLKVWFIPARLLSQCNGGGAPAPMFASSAGWGISILGSGVGRFAFPGWEQGPQPRGCEPFTPPCPVTHTSDSVQLCLKSAVMAYDFTEGPPAAVLREHLERTGLPVMPPTAQFGLITWRQTVAGAGAVLDQIDELQRRDIPVGGVLLDDGWETGNCAGSLTFDRKEFPDPRAMIAAVHKRGVRFWLWIVPYVERSSKPGGCGYGTYPPGYFVGGRDTQGNPRWPHDLDLTDPATRATFEKKLTALVRLGVDGIKADRGDETDYEASQFHTGTGATQHNEYPVNFARAVMDVLRRERGSQAMTMFRSAYSGSQHILPGFWGADQPTTLAGLQAAIRSGVTAGASGYGVWGSDIGGYSARGAELGPNARQRFPTPAIFIRWAQLGAISPIMEVGGVARNGLPWTYPDATVAAFRDAVILHAELYPLLHGLAAGAHARGDAILRPLAFDYPGDPGSWKADLEVLVGPNLLAAPVASPRPEADPGHGARTRVSVHLPPDSWTDLSDGVSRRGPRALIRLVPVERLPLFLRTGTAIPFDGRRPDVWQARWRNGDLDRRGRAGWLVAPPVKGDTATRTTGDALAGRIRVERRGGVLDLVLSGARAQTQVFVSLADRPRAVIIDGRATAGAALSKLRPARTGWTFSPGPVRGVVVKLTPRHGRATVRVLLPAS